MNKKQSKYYWICWCYENMQGGIRHESRTLLNQHPFEFIHEQISDQHRKKISAVLTCLVNWKEISAAEYDLWHSL